jgi:hypothetical protein
MRGAGTRDNSHLCPRESDENKVFPILILMGTKLHSSMSHDREISGGESRIRSPLLSLFVTK